MTELPKLIVTRNGVPVADQAEGVRQFIEAARDAGKPWTPDHVIVAAAIRWSKARAAVHDLSISDPTYRAKLNELSEAEDALSRATKDRT